MKAEEISAYATLSPEELRLALAELELDEELDELDDESEDDEELDVPLEGLPEEELFL